MTRKNCLQLACACLCQIDMDYPAVFRVAFAFDQPVALKVVYDRRHITSALEHFCTYFTLCHRAKMIQSFQHSELRGCEVIQRVPLGKARTKRISTAGQLDEGIQSAHLCAGPGIMG